MDAETRDPDSPVIRRLLEEGQRFSFFRAVQILESCSPQGVPIGGTGPARDETVRLRAELSLVFPRTTVTSVRRIPAEGELPRYAITQTFMGLFGIRSPMPEIYTEELLQRVSDKDPVRDLLDMFHHRILSLLYRAWARNRPHVSYRPGGADRLTWMVFCIAGLGEEAIRRTAYALPGGLLRYAPLLARRSKSAEGLEMILSDFLDGAGVRVEPHVPRSVVIPPDQRARLGVSGCTLGEDFSAGDRIPDRAGKFRLWIGPLERRTYRSLAPGGEARADAAALVRLYLLDTLEYDVVLGILAAEKPPFCLSGSEDGPRLGIDTWFPGESSADAWVGFPSCPAPPAGLDEERAA